MESLTEGIISNSEVELEVNNYIEGNKFIKVQYKSKKTGNVKITSPFFKGEITYRIRSGPIELNNSYIQIISTETLKIGGNLKYVIHLKDGNDIDDLNQEMYQKLFENKADELTLNCNLTDNGNNKELKYNILECSELITEENYDNINKYH